MGDRGKWGRVVQCTRGKIFRGFSTLFDGGENPPEILNSELPPKIYSYTQIFSMSRTVCMYIFPDLFDVADMCRDCGGVTIYTVRKSI